MADFDILILAAGEGKRMGSVKQLHPFKETNFIELTIQKALNLSARNVLVVLGAYFEKLLPVVETYPITILQNINWSLGMGSSLSFGLNHIKKQHSYPKGVLVLLIDQPFLMEDHDFLPRLIQIWQSDPTKIVAADYGNRFGVPAVLPQHILQHLESLENDRGAGPLLNSGKFPVKAVLIGELGKDIDE
jgi:molybdenum cofactor cytidylyltransferase